MPSISRPTGRTTKASAPKRSTSTRAPPALPDGCSSKGRQARDVEIDGISDQLRALLADDPPSRAFDEQGDR